MSVDVELVYIYVLSSPEYKKEAYRFIQSYAAHPPWYQHRTVVVFNGGQPSESDLRLLSNLQNPSYMVRDNTGWDIGGFMDASLESKSNMCVYCGSNVHFWRSGWMRRMVEVWEKRGPGCYGTSASYEVTVHLNSTGFWCDPKLMNAYPFHVRTKEDRYNFEHGRSNLSQNIRRPDTNTHMAFWRRCHRAGLPVMLVTWDGEYNWWNWRSPNNIFRRGDQSNMLLWWKHSDMWSVQTPDVQQIWSKSTDTLTDGSFNLKTRQFS